MKNQEKVNTCNADVTHCFDTMLEPNKSAYQNEFFHLGLTICTLVSEASSLHVSQLPPRLVCTSVCKFINDSEAQGDLALATAAGLLAMMLAG